jgi:hypothetical protein
MNYRPSWRVAKASVWNADNSTGLTVTVDVLTLTSVSRLKALTC